jgi:hypothetical protein
MNLRFVPEIVVQIISDIYHSLEDLSKSPPKRQDALAGSFFCSLPNIGVIMDDQIYCSSETTKLAKALIQVQRTLQPATKDRLNPFTHSNYATLNSVMDSCREALLNNGIWLTQYPVPAEPGHLGLVTKLVHAESGQWQSSHAVVPLPKNDPQGLGIAMTYIRRYSVSAMLGIVTEDDTDGNMPKDSGKGGHRPVNRHAIMTHLSQ